MTSCLRQSFLAEARLTLAVEETRGVLDALHLGWCVAETRGRNRPGGPPGGTGQMPDHNDHALPLRMERTATELRIEAQSVAAALAKKLYVDDDDDGDGGFGVQVDNKAKLLAHVRTPKVVQAMRGALDVLEEPPAGSAPPGSRPPGSGPGGSGPAGSGPDPATAPTLSAPERAAKLLQAGLVTQQRVVHEQREAAAVARRVLAAALARSAQASGQPADEAAEAARAVREAEGSVRLVQATCAAETKGLAALAEVIRLIQQAPSAKDAAQAGADAIRAHLQAVSAAAQILWAELAELIWRFDAHIQDVLGAAAEDRATAYQLGRGLAETYWALDPGAAGGSTGWTFLLGDERCGELSRLAGRLAAYLCEYTPPAIAGSLQVWHDVARTPGWRADPAATDSALYHQIRRWYELIILGQDPTTMIEPGAILRDYRTLSRALRLFLPQLAGTLAGLGFLVALLVLLGVGGSAWQKTVFGVLAVVGLSVAGISGTVKNSAQAVFRRLCQDAYGDLVAFAVQTAPPPPKRSAVRHAIARRELTPPTPN